MFRYLAVLWNPESEVATAAAAATELRLRAARPSWTRTLFTPGAVVYCEHTHDVHGGVAVLPGNMGILLGIAFSTRDGTELTAQSTAASTARWLSHAALTETRGRHAVEVLWGSFVLVFVSGDHKKRFILRSPAAALPCFYASQGDVCVFFSEVDDFCAIHSAEFSINWSLIRAQAALGDHLTRETGIVQIESVEGGECVAQTETTLIHDFLWNPCRIAHEPAFETFPAAVIALRRATQAAVHKWGSRYTSVLLELSGGLDSSIVLSCLSSMTAGPAVHCVNFYSDECPGDERDFARSMASKAHAPLSEMPRRATEDLTVFLRCSRTARPALNFTGPGRFETVLALMRHHGCQAIFDGELGDSLFGSAAGAEPVTDHLYRRRSRMRVLEVARDVARMTRLSVWSALVSGIRYLPTSSWNRSLFAFSTTVGGCDSNARRFVTEEALHAYTEEQQRYVHYWFREDPSPPPGAVLLIFALLLTTSTELHIPFSEFSALNYVHPLISQPLIEVALRIPGSFAVKSGWNRAVARTAFAPDLPLDVLRRTHKTSTSPWVTQTIRRHATWLREFLLDGVLAREHILDTKRVEATLSCRVSRSTTIPADLFYQAYIEAWLRQWTR